MKVETKDSITIKSTRYKILAQLNIARFLREFFHFSNRYDGPWFGSVVSRPAASASFGHVLEMPVLNPHPDLLNKTL